MEHLRPPVYEHRDAEPLLPLIASGLEKDPDDRPGLDAFLERCSALAEGGDAPLPEPAAR
ncbi:hypothetical protein [Actinoallomurus sp. NPDC052274]|uniref:hypothetical protein n=1 Tax=Actinoallomurus sp. NPDC052274 TaxID=3155420 RepID=UPI00343A851D